MLWKRTVRKIKAAEFAYRGVGAEHAYRELQERIPPYRRAIGIRGLFKETKLAKVSSCVVLHCWLGLNHTTCPTRFFYIAGFIGIHFNNKSSIGFFSIFSHIIGTENVQSLCSSSRHHSYCKHYLRQKGHWKNSVCPKSGHWDNILIIPTLNCYTENTEVNYSGFSHPSYRFKQLHDKGDPEFTRVREKAPLSPITFSRVPHLNRSLKSLE